MSERWKYQIKTGTFWGVLMAVFTLLFNIKEISFKEQISNPNFWIRLIGYIVVGVLILGYFNWKGKQERDNSEKK